MADQFVERIVAADILARGDHLALRIAQGGGVDGAGFGVERLVRADRLERAEDRSGPDRRRRGQFRQRPLRLFEILDPAQAAGGFADAVAHPLQHPVVALGGKLDAEQYACFLGANLDAGHVRRRLDQPLRPGEADCEILDIGRRRHHHRIADAEEADRDRHLRRHRPLLRSNFPSASIFFAGTDVTNCMCCCILLLANPRGAQMATTTRDSEAKAALARLLDNYSAELTTRDHKSLDAAADILRPQTRVFVAAMPRDTADDMIAAAIRLHKANMVAIPHIVARNIPDEATLDRMLARLSAEAGVDRAHVVGGDRDDPAGAFDSALQLLETGLFAKYGITRIAIACYPEGHPRIPDAVLEQARADKTRVAAEQGLSVWLVSQFAFEAAPIIGLARNMRAQGIDDPYRVGIAGPASHATLLKFAMMCGVGASLRALRERGDFARNMLMGETPEALLTEIALAREAEPGLNIQGVHFFTFGSLIKTAQWVESVRG